MEYPKDCYTKNQEVMVLEEKGQYVKYTYIDPKTGKPVKEGKYGLLLKSEDSTKHLFVIPLKDKSMIVKDEKEERKTAIFDPKTKKEMDF